MRELGLFRGGIARRLLVPAAVLTGCLLSNPSSDGRPAHAQAPNLASTSLRAGVSWRTADGASSIGLSGGQAISHSRAAHREAKQLERAGASACVDRYYEATVFAHAALVAAGSAMAEGASHAGWGRAADQYNQSLADCLATAGRFGRLDPRSHLQIEGPNGPRLVRVMQRRFVWSPLDFDGLIDARGVSRQREQHRRHRRNGLGVPLVSVRLNRNQTAADRFLPPRSFFPVTAILRPQIGPWLGLAGAAPADDVLELHDPLRTTTVALNSASVPLASDLDAPIALAEESGGSRLSTRLGLLNPSSEIDKNFLGFLEPYQPGKIPVVFIHGLNSSPYTFSDLVNDLRSCPEFLDHFQVAVFRYPTGIPFLRSAALFRHQLRNAETTLDPQRRDPGLQNTVLVGHSMGGLLAKLQITWSGDALWNLCFTRPLDSLNTSESTRTLMRDVFFFEPLPFIRRVVFIGTPHDGAAMATRTIGRVTSRLVQRSPDSFAQLQQLERDNPGAILPALSELPTSIDLLARRGPVLEVMRQLPINPATTYHSIAGTAAMPTLLARGDGVVPLSSARSDGAASERWVPSVHTRLNSNPETSEEIGRILADHFTETYAPATRR